MRCEFCDRQIPGDSLLCPYCGHTVLPALPPTSSSGSPLSASRQRTKRFADWLAAFAAFAYFLSSAGCCLLALMVNIRYNQLDVEGWWPDFWLTRTPATTQEPTETIETTVVSPVGTPRASPVEE